MTRHFVIFIVFRRLLIWRKQTFSKVGSADAGVGTDFHAVEQNKVSLTPLKIDLTDYDIFSEVQTWVDAYEK